MKIRKSFVANSSSSSFIISLDKITAEQLYKIHNHREVANEMEGFDEYDNWDHIFIRDNNLIGQTIMDNFDMYEFLQRIGIKKEDVTWGDY